ncbi:MAG: YkgJ family cysteine cluster protein [Spirochaetaceae bacterium]|nr:YkgJ family cysteine cluster protein [Spirochaetaceae bacterium]
MIEKYQTIINRGKSRFNDTKKFIRLLKKVKSSELDALCGKFHTLFAGEINCLDCANCCRGTGPLLKNRDISRLSKSMKMKTGQFVENYLVTDEEGDMIFKELPCPFIDKKNYCIVYEDRPAACRDYPHTDRRNMRKYLKPTLENYRICPIVYLVIEELKKTFR